MQIYFKIISLSSKLLIFIHMENLLIVLVFVGSIVYKIYSNYKEEMEKAAKRKPQHPTLPQNVEPKTIAKPYQQPSIPPPIPKKSTTMSQREFVTKSNIVQDTPEEVQRIKQNRKTQSKPLTEKVVGENQTIQFDLRQAVIQAAILERPYR